MDLKTRLLWLLRVVSLICAGICGSAVILVVAGTAIIGGVTAYRMADSWLDLDPFSRTYDEADQNSDMRSNRGAILNWVLACTKTQSIGELPNHVQRLYASSSSIAMLRDGPKALPEGVRAPNRRELAILSISSTLGLQRTLLRDKVRIAYSWWQWTSIVTIVLGLVTTIVVSLSSTKFFAEGSFADMWIRGAAIGLPAIGTAAAAFIAFYSPQAEWSQSSRTLAGLSQLHGQIALSIWKQKCVDDDAKVDPIDTAIDEWAKRYIDIQTVAVSAQQGNSTSAPSTNSSGTGSGKETQAK